MLEDLKKLLIYENNIRGGVFMTISKMKIILIIIFNIFILSSCNTISTNNLVSDEISEIRLIDVNEFISNIITPILKKDEELSAKDIVVEEDDLLLNERSYLNTVNNISVKVFLNINDDYDDIENIINSFEDEFLNKLAEKDTPEIIRIRSIALIYSDESFNNEIVFIETNENINNLSNIKDEDLVQLNKYIYNKFNENIEIIKNESEYEIFKMGKKENCFIIETKIFYYNLDDYENILKDINLKTIDDINENEDIIRLLKKNNIEDIKFIYNSKWYKHGEPLIFDYELTY